MPYQVLTRAQCYANVGVRCRGLCFLAQPFQRSAAVFAHEVCEAAEFRLRQPICPRLATGARQVVRCQQGRPDTAFGHRIASKSSKNSEKASEIHFLAFRSQSQSWCTLFALPRQQQSAKTRRHVSNSSPNATSARLLIAQRRGTAGEAQPFAWLTRRRICANTQQPTWVRCISQLRTFQVVK